MQGLSKGERSSDRVVRASALDTVDRDSNPFRIIQHKTYHSISLKQRGRNSPKTALAVGRGSNPLYMAGENTLPTELSAQQVVNLSIST